MSEGLNELETALRQLQPTPLVQGRMLIDIGRAAGARSIRRWQGATLMASLSALALAVLQLSLPGPTTVVQIVYLPSVKSPGDRPGTIAEAIDDAEVGDAPHSRWRPWTLEARQRLEPVSSDATNEPAIEPAPLRAGDVYNDASLVTTFTKSGGRR